MGKRRDAKMAALVADAVKVGLSGTPQAASGAAVTPGSQIDAGLRSNAMPSLARSLARDPGTFGAQMGPNFPLIPWPIDELGPDGRPAPRKYQYDIAENLQVGKYLAKWTTLASAAVQCDLLARAIAIRTSDVVKMDWSFNPSTDLVNTIMADNNCTLSEAGKIARTQTQGDIVRLSSFMENPYPQSDRGWSEFVTEALWQILVYDGWAVHPAFTLGGDLLGLDTIDASTIKCLLNNYGDTPRPPDPAYQQITWGFPRGEFVASANSNVANFLGGEYNISDRDQLSYFVMNRRTNSPYGFSPVEQSLPIANLYMERLNWQMAEYKFGTTVASYFETDSADIELPNMQSASRIIEDRFQGSTANRQGMLFLPGGVKSPVFAPTQSEKYKPELDEHYIKRIAANFGVAPAQLGVVARAGLGGGKGAGEAEHDNVETVSSKPMNNYLEECVNSLCRRYLKATRSVTFQLKDDEGTQDEVMVSTANKNYVSFAAKTSNEIRGELGLPLSDQPEADELMIVTPNGPVFLRGTLAAQLGPTTPGGQDAPVHDSGDSGSQPQEGSQGPQKEGAQGRDGQTQGGQGGAPDGQRQSGSSSPELKAAEAKAFKAFVAKGARGREFEFSHHTSDEIDALKAGISTERPKSRQLVYD